jgi:hypothetical protein
MAVAGCSSQPERGWTQEDGYRWRAVAPGGFFSQTGFTLLDSSQTGIAFGNTLTREAMSRNRNYTNGSGVAVADVNGDGWVDLYFGQMNGPNRLYLNEGDGTLSFREATDAAGVAHRAHYTTGVAFADVDGDGDQDLLVASMSKAVTLYRNDGTGQFTRVENSGLNEGDGSTTLALADIDGDGDLDLYVTNYKEKSARDIFRPTQRSFKETVRKTGEEREPFALKPPFDEHYEIIYTRHRGPDRRELGAEDQLYLNDGDGTFTEVTDLDERFRTSTGAPMGMQEDWGLTAKFQDLNDDGHPDLYVANDFWTPDRVWMNQGDGTFRAIDPLSIRNFSFSSMAVDFSDVNVDGERDIFVTEMLATERRRRARQQISYDPYDPAVGDLSYQPQYMRNSLYLGRRDSTFAEITYYSETAATGWSWATRFLDVDLDGYEDLLVNTGHSHDVLDVDTQEEISRKVRTGTKMLESPIFEYPSLPLVNQALKNQGDRTFTETSADWGFTTEDISHGLATADFDRDGDLDLAVSRLNDPAVLYRNSATQPRIGVRLKGTPPNTRGIGAQLKLAGGPVPQTREMEAGGDYLSSSESYVVFAATEGARHTLTITWPDGATTTLDSVRANRIYEVQQSSAPETETSGRSVRVDADSSTSPIFADVSERIAYTHPEPYYNDFGVQQLVPLRMSRLGPGVSWLNADGDTGGDLYVGAGKGGRMGIFDNDSTGQFTRRRSEVLTEPALGDQTTLLGWTAADGLHLIVGVSNYQQGQAQAPSAYHYRLDENDTTLVQRFQGIRSTTGPLAAADYTGDGHLDLFIGGRFKPAKYPEDARSRLYTNDDGRFRIDRRNSRLLQEAGLVTSATFVDYDTDGDQDLLLGRAWDSIVLLENQDGAFEDVSSEVGLSRKRGWWNGVATGDFNNDGRPDLVATNWGLNSRYQRVGGRPLKMFFDDFDGDRSPEVVEAHYDPDRQGYVPYKPFYSFYKTIPSFRRRVDSHARYARSTVADLAGRSSENIPAREITTLRHTLFLNTGGEFEAHPLPPKAQFAPAFAAGVADYNNDGHEDLFLSQNMYSLPKLTPRQDAGRGLWLRGDGTGDFAPVDGSVSGVTVYGEQRGAALGDFNRDARVDLVVSQNGAATKLYRNQTPAPGVRVVLQGPPANQEAFGASVRVVYADGSKGPLRTVQAGSGYWSQDSAVQVLGTAKEVAQIEVTWPGGETESAPLEADQNEVVIKHPE